MIQENDAFAPGGAPEQWDAAAELAGLDEEYGKAEAMSSEEVPDGKFQVRVKSVRLDKSRNGNPMLRYDLVVISGAQVGRHIFKNAVITPNSLSFVKGDLKLLGVTLGKLSELPNHLEALLDKGLEVTKRTKGDFVNVYFNRLLQVPAAEAPAGGPIPF